MDCFLVDIHWLKKAFCVERLSLKIHQCQFFRYIKTGDLKSTQNWIQYFFNKKFKNHIYFLTCILPDYIAHDVSKEFFKNSHFEIMTAGFQLRSQNTLRWEKSLICHWNIDSLKQKMSYVYFMVPKNDQNIV